MSIVKNENYYQITGYMVNQLQLKGNELLVYAIIFGFSQDGESQFEGSRQYLCDFTGASKRTIDYILESLVEKKYIIKNSEKINNVIRNKYKVNFDVLNCNTGAKIATPLVKTTPNNIVNNIEDNNINNSNNINTKESKKEKEPEHHFGTYGRIMLTTSEYNKLCDDYTKNYIDKVIEKLDEYVEMNNNKNKYKKFNLVIRKAIRENWSILKDLGKAPNNANLNGYKFNMI